MVWARVLVFIVLDRRSLACAVLGWMFVGCGRKGYMDIGCSCIGMQVRCGVVCVVCG